MPNKLEYYHVTIIKPLDYENIAHLPKLPGLLLIESAVDLVMTANLLAEANLIPVQSEWFYPGRILGYTYDGLLNVDLPKCIPLTTQITSLLETNHFHRGRNLSVEELISSGVPIHSH